MTLDPTALRPPVAGFGQCGTCAYREASGRPEICYSCALLTITAAGGDGTCGICDHPFHENGTCHNPTCARKDRFFKWNWAIGIRTGVLQSRLGRYKFEGAKGWALIFARILVGFLDDHRQSFGDFELIVGNPAFTGASAERNWDHIRLILEAAAEAGGDRWPFDLQNPPAIVKTKHTSPLRQAARYQHRREIAETEIRGALAIPDPSRIIGKKILVFDDVFTDGLTLNEVARALRAERAAVVCGVSLARQIYQGPR